MWRLKDGRTGPLTLIIRPASSARAWRGKPPHRPSPQLPAFCRSRRPSTVAVTVSSLAAMRLLGLLGLTLQLSTLLLVLAGPVPPRPAASTSTITPLSDR